VTAQAGPSARASGRADGETRSSDRRPTICFPFVGDSVGGSHLSVRGLLDGLDRSRYRILVVPQVENGAIARLFAPYSPIIGPKLERHRFVPGHRFGLRQVARALSALPRQIAFLRRERVDIVHTNDGRTHASWALAARLAGARLVWHHRGDTQARGLRLAAPLLADHVFAVSRFAMPRSGIVSAAGKAQVLYSPFDTTIAVDREAARKRLLEVARLAPDTLVIGYFGTLIMRKRPLLFVDAIAALRERLPTRPLAGLLFGIADEAEVEAAIVERIRARGVGDCVHLMGYRTPGAEWIAGCDQLMVPAINEPLGRTLVEAMLVGTPIVATRSGGNPEALRDGALGILVEPENADALADACLGIVENPARTAAMTRRAEEDARQRFGEAAHCRQVADVYERLLAGRRRV